MRLIVFSILIGILNIFTLTSCASDNEIETEKRIEFAKIVESRTTQDKLNDLYVGCDGDVEALARVLKATPSSIERLRKGETEATQAFEERLTDVSIYYFMNDQCFTKVQSVLDEEYGWYDTILNFPSHHPNIFWGVTIGLFILTACVFIPPVAVAASVLMILELLVFFITWICSLCFSPEVNEDKYTDSINPVIETII